MIPDAILIRVLLSVAGGGRKRICVANWSKRIVRDLAQSPALLRSADTMSIPWTSGALDTGQADALPFWPYVRRLTD